MENTQKDEIDRKNETYSQSFITANDYCYDDYDLYKVQRKAFLEAKMNENFIKDSHTCSMINEEERKEND